MEECPYCGEEFEDIVQLLRHEDGCMERLK